MGGQVFLQRFPLGRWWYRSIQFSAEPACHKLAPAIAGGTPSSQTCIINTGLQHHLARWHSLQACLPKLSVLCPVQAPGQNSLLVTPVCLSLVHRQLCGWLAPREIRRRKKVDLNLRKRCSYRTRRCKYRLCRKKIASEASSIPGRSASRSSGAGAPPIYDQTWEDPCKQ